PINQMEGIQQDIPRTIAMMPATNGEDYENIVLRLEGIPSLVDQTITLLDQGLAAKTTPPKITLRDVPAQVEAQIFDDPAKSPMLQAFLKMPVGAIKPADADQLKARATNAYRQKVLPAFRKLHDYLISRYLPACREAVDVESIPNGAAMYAYNVKWHTTTN